MFFSGLSQLAALLGGRPVGPDQSGAPDAFGIDSRTIQKGGLFFTLPGTRVDGHDYLEALAQKGAWGAVVENEERARASGISAVVVPCVAEALYDLAKARRATLKYPMIAVTGTNGKTTTKDLISQLLSQDLKVASTRGNFNNQLGLPLSLLAAPEDAQVGVFELGMSSRGEIDRLGALLQPHYGVITNVSLAHIEGLGSLEEVRAAKGELIPHIHPEGILYLNADDPSSRYFAVRAEGREVRCVTTRGVLGAGVHFHLKKADLNGVEGDLVLDMPQQGRQLTQSIHWPIPGRHMVYPLLFAVSLAQDLQMSPDLKAWAEVCASGNLVATGGRMRVRSSLAGASIIDDSYNANPASMEAALDFLIELETTGDKFAVLGDMLELGDVSETCHRAVLERMASTPELKQVWFVGNEFHSSHMATSTPPPKPETQAPAKDRVSVGASREEACEALHSILKPGDVVLIKGSRGIGLEQIAQSLESETACS